MTYFAPVTMATRPCKSSRSFPGVIFDAELPICTTAVRKGGGICVTITCLDVSLEALVFMDHEHCSGPIQAADVSETSGLCRATTKEPRFH